MVVQRWLQAIGGVAAAFLPSRHWNRLEARVPVAASAVFSGILTFAAGALGAIAGFLAFASRNASQVNDLVLRIAADQVAHPSASTPEISSTAAAGFNAFTPFFFVLFTPIGWLTGYLAFSGAVRAAAAAFGDPIGDPILTGADAAAHWALVTRARRSAARRRLELEGPEIPDRLVGGRTAGLPDADIVVVSSRVKEGWTAGLIVMTEEKWYRLGTPVERTVEGRVRTLYPLKEHNDLEVARRTVRYDLGPRPPAPARE